MLANPERTIAILREAVRDKRGGGWRAAQANWGDLAGSTHSIRSSILLPPNPRFEDFATEVITRPDRPARDLTDVEVRAGLVQGGIMGLAIQAFQFAEPSRGRSKSVVVGKSLTQKIVIKKAGLGIHGPGLATQTSSVPSTDADFELVLEMKPDWPATSDWTRLPRPRRRRRGGRWPRCRHPHQPSPAS